MLFSCDVFVRCLTLVGVVLSECSTFKRCSASAAYLQQKPQIPQNAEFTYSAHSCSPTFAKLPVLFMCTEQSRPLIVVGQFRKTTGVTQLA